MELVDTPDLGSGAERCGGSSPPSRTKYQRLRSVGCRQIETKCMKNLDWWSPLCAKKKLILFKNCMQIIKIIVIVSVITASVSLYGCSKIIPEPNETRESQSLLVIPVSVEYPSNFGEPVKGWGIKFSGINKPFMFNPKMRQKFLVLEIEPGNYYVSKFIHPDQANYNYFINGSYPRSKAELKTSKRIDLTNLRFQLKNKHIQIANFRYVFWKQLSESRRTCCTYYGILETIDEKVQTSKLDELIKLENFDKWEFQK